MHIHDKCLFVCLFLCVFVCLFWITVFLNLPKKKRQQVMKLLYASSGFWAHVFVTGILSVKNLPANSILH